MICRYLNVNLFYFIYWNYSMTKYEQTVIVKWKWFQHINFISSFAVTILFFSCFRYSFAIVGINLTSMAYHLLKDSSLRVHFYNTIRGRPCVNDFHYVYCKFSFTHYVSWLSLRIVSAHNFILFFFQVTYFMNLTSSG